MSMNEHVKKIVGKRIKGILAKRNEKYTSPASQLFLVFDDGTYFEIYTCREELAWAKGLNSGGMDKARNYTREFKTVQEEEIDR